MVKRKTKKRKTSRRLPELVPEKVVPRLVAELNESASFRGLAQALEAAEIVCKTLYHGEPKYVAQGRRLGPIFRRLTKADGLPYSAVTLRCFLSVYELHHRIDGARVWHIGLSHYIMVLPLARDLQQKALETASEQRLLVVFQNPNATKSRGLSEVATEHATESFATADRTIASLHRAAPNSPSTGRTACHPSSSISRFSRAG
jgi:hypothetical protein